MSLIYWLFSISLPLVLLIYSSVQQFYTQKSIPFGKWTVMILTIYLMGWVSWLFQDIYIIYFTDLIVKIIIPFLPSNINHLLETKISNFHLQIWIDQFRAKVIHLICSNYIQLTDYILSKMDTNQSEQFKQRLFEGLKKSQRKLTPTFKTSQKQNKFFNSNQITFDQAPYRQSQKENIQKQTQTSNFIKKQQKYLVGKQSLQKKYNDMFSQSIKQNQPQKFPKFSYDNSWKSTFTAISNNNPTEGSYNKNSNTNSQTPSSRISKQSQQRMLQEISGQRKISFQNSKQGTVTYSLQNKNSIKQTYPIMHKSQQPYFLSESSTKKSVEPQSFVTKVPSQQQTHPKKLVYSQHKNFDSSNENEQLINKLDVSQYSQMFDDQEEYFRERVLECRVEVILQIGIGTAVRLQIYNIQLYSNRDLRIVSLYDREFETHKLHSVKSLANGYYELIFQNGKIHSRKCKFRGANFQPFLKYIV